MQDEPRETDQGRQDAVLVDLATRIGEAGTDLAGAFRLVTETVSDKLGVARASVWLEDPDETGAVLRCQDLFELASGAHTTGAALHESGFPVYFDAMRRERTVAAEDAAAHPAFAELAESYFAPLGITSQLDATLRVNGRFVGVMCLEHQGPQRRWTPEEQAFAGSVADVVSMAIESDRRRQAETALERERVFLRTVVDLSPSLIFARNLRSGYTLLNRALTDWLCDALEPGDPRTQRRAVRVLAEPHLAELAAVFAAGDADVATTREELVFPEQQVRDAHGAKRWLRIVKRPILEPDGSVSGVLGIAEDVTARHVADEERKRLETGLRQAQRLESLGLLAGGVAHDFNNLLTPILGYTTLQRVDIPAEHPIHGDLLAIRLAAERGRDLTGQLLAFSRKQVLELRTLDLSDEIRTASKMLARVLPENVRLDLRLAAGPLPVRADRTQLHQVFVNLAINARDAMPCGGRLTITTRLEAEPGAGLLLLVEDTGTGIPPDVLPRIFEPFFTTKERGRGTGLGLSTVFGIVKQHAGRIDVRSVPDKGTRFEVRFPLADPPPASAGEEEGERSGTFRVGGSGTVLVVEDDDLVRDLVAELVGLQGYEVITVRDAEEALSIARTHVVDLLLTDVGLPGMDGPTLTARILEIQPQVRAIWMSGYPADAVPDDVESQGRVYLRKPFTARDLAAKLREALRP